MPKILRIINRLNLGGPTYNAAYLSKYLAPEFETMLVAGIKEESEESSEFIVREMGLDPVYIPEMHREISFNNDRIALKKIKKLIADFKPDIVHTHAAKAGTLGRIAAKQMKVPVIVHTFHGHVFHSYFNPVKTFIFKNVERYLAGISTKIIAISDIQKHELCVEHRICKPSKAEVIPLGFDLSRFTTFQAELRTVFRTEWHLDDDVVAVGIIGRIVPVKNHTLFLKAFKIAKEQYQGKTRAFIVGDGSDRPLMEHLCAQLGLTVSIPEKVNFEADVIFTSWILDIEKPLAGFDIVAMTSLNEGTPVSLIEAQAAGVPVVSTEAGGIRNVVIENESALLSPSGDVELFAKNLARMISDSKFRDEFRLKGRAFVMDRFHYQRLVDDTRRLYHRLPD